MTSFEVCSSLASVSFACRQKLYLKYGSDLREHRDVGAGAEELVSFAGQEQHVDGGVEAGFEDRLVQLPHHLVAVGVRGGVIEGEHGDATDHFVLHERRVVGHDRAS